MSVTIFRACFRQEDIDESIQYDPSVDFEQRKEVTERMVNYILDLYNGKKDSNLSMFLQASDQYKKNGTGFYHFVSRYKECLITQDVISNDVDYKNYEDQYIHDIYLYKNPSELDPISIENMILRSEVESM